MNSKKLLGTALLAVIGGASQAAVVYSEGFDGGFASSNWSRGDTYWSDCDGQGNCVQASGGHSGAYFQLGTATGPEPDHRFFISTMFGVAANTDYTLTFFVRDDYAGYYPYNVPIQAQFNGVNVGGIVKASTGGWNQIDLVWNSGSATTAQFALKNEYQLSGYYQGGGQLDWGYGNDFALDSISVTGEPAAARLPEPASLSLVGLALTGLALSRRRKS